MTSAAAPGTRLLGNAGWNLLGVAVPIAAALIAIPTLVHTLGDSRFGFLSIAWVLVGYFGIFDLGIGRATTHSVARRLAGDSVADVSDLVWTGLAFLAATGIGLGISIVVLGDWICRIIEIPEELRGESLRALQILAASVPFVLLTASLRGLLEAQQAFRVVNLAVMPIGALQFLAPAAAAWISPTLPGVCLSLLLLRVAGCLVLTALCARRTRNFFSVSLSRVAARELMSVGGWMTVSNVASPLMVNLDRLFLGSLMPVAAVTYYVTPFEVVSKLLIVPSAIANASFPEFSRLAGQWSRREAGRLLVKGLVSIAVLLIPPVLGILMLAHELLAWWVSPELADRSAGVMRILAIGMLVNGAAYIPYAFIQGLGRSDVTAKCHLVELVFYVPSLYLMIGLFGVEGVAIAWVLRACLDTLLLFGYATRCLQTQHFMG